MSRTKKGIVTRHITNVRKFLGLSKRKQSSLTVITIYVKIVFIKIYTDIIARKSAPWVTDGIYSPGLDS